MSRKLSRARRRLAPALLAGVFAVPSLATPQPAESPSVSRVAGVETGSIPLGATVLSAWAAAGEPGFEPALWLLLRAPKSSGGGRSLARLTFGEGARLETIASGLERWMETLAAIDLGFGPELVAGGEGRLAALGLRAGPPAGEGTTGSDPAPRPLLEQPGFELASISTGRIESGILARITVAEPGRVRVWEGDGAGALRETAPVRIPFSVTRSSNGLRRSNPDLLTPLALLGTDANGARSTALFVGPEAIGHLRLRGEWIDLAAPAAPRAELWAALPGPEKISQAWPVRLGSSSILIVRTQAADEMNLFESQRLRVLPLAEDRTRAGALPTLAVELDSKRWHETAVSLADVDGDGNEDLLAVFPEGLSGSDLVAQWWRGSGGGRFESTARRSDVEDGGESWQLVPAAGAGSPPAVLLVRDRFIELRPFAAAGKKALAPAPALTFAYRPAADGKRKKTVTVGTGKDAVEVENVDPEVELLGAVDLDGQAGQEILALQADGHGQERLFFARRVPNP